MCWKISVQRFQRYREGPKGIRVTGTAFLFVCFVSCFRFQAERIFCLWERDLRKDYMGHWNLKKNEIEGPLPNVFNCPLSFSLSVTSNRRGPWERDCAKYCLPNGVTQSPLPLQTKQAAIKALQGALARWHVLHKAVSSFFAFFGVGTKFLKIK